SSARHAHRCLHPSPRDADVFGVAPKGGPVVRVIVIGGGIVGTSTAYHLAKGGAQVALVDRGDSGQATAAGAGIVWPWLSERPAAWHHIAVPAAEYYPTLSAQLAEEGLDSGYTRVGGLSVGSDVERVAELTH